MKHSNEEVDADEQVLRIPLDAKATVKVGPFAQGGKSRVPTKAVDHDFEPVATVTPVGILLPASNELFVYRVTSKVTSDCLVDRIVQWWETVKERFAHIKTLLINLDNGPESHSRRTQFMQRLVEFVQQYRITVRLAYYPSYHDLERRPPRGRTGDDHLSDRRQIDQGGNGCGGNPASAVATSGKVVRGHQLFLVS